MLGSVYSKCVQIMAWHTPTNDPGKVQHFAWVYHSTEPFSIPIRCIRFSISFSVSGLLTAWRNKRTVTSLSVGNILEQGKGTFSNTYKNSSFGHCDEHYLKLWTHTTTNTTLFMSFMKISRVSADDLMTSGLHLNRRIPFQNVFFSLYLNYRPLASLCLASHYWSEVQKSQIKPSFVEYCTLHPLTTPLSTVWGQSRLKLTSPNTLYKMYKMNYKESQFPSPCKWEAGFSPSLKGFIVSR